jgi:hypothetical protein
MVSKAIQSSGGGRSATRRQDDKLPTQCLSRARLALGDSTAGAAAGASGCSSSSLRSTSQLTPAACRKGAVHGGIDLRQSDATWLSVSSSDLASAWRNRIQESGASSVPECSTYAWLGRPRMHNHPSRFCVSGEESGPGAVRY